MTVIFVTTSMSGSLVFSRGNLPEGRHSIEKTKAAMTGGDDRRRSAMNQGQPGKISSRVQRSAFEISSVARLLDDGL